MHHSVLEICAGAGGQAAGLEAAGFEHAAAIENDHDACNTLRTNRRAWEIIERSVRDVSGRAYRGIDLLAGGVPCPPFSVAGKQLGADDDRDLFPEALRLIEEARPRAVMLENVPGFATARFSRYRNELIEGLALLGYEADWRVLNACWYGVSQLRPRFVLVAFRNVLPQSFRWPQPLTTAPGTVGEVLTDLMAKNGWRGAASWSKRADGIAPTLVGGSKKHGGPDLGPTRARQQWKLLGVDGLGIADEPPGRKDPIDMLPRLTVRMAARLQGFSDSWVITGAKTAAYRQVGNAFPPPVAKAVGAAIRVALTDAHPQPVPKQAQLFGQTQ